MKPIVREEYLGLSKDMVLQKAYDLGVTYESYSFGCSQCTVAALYRILDFPAAIVKAASSNAGGAAGQLLGTCGGVIGGMMVLDYFCGRPFEHMSDSEIIPDPNLEDLHRSVQISRQLVNKFIETYGGFNCTNVQLQLYGRVFYLADDDDMKKLEKAGGHSDPTKCPGVVGNAAKWTFEILLNNDIIAID